MWKGIANLQMLEGGKQFGRKFSNFIDLQSSHIRETGNFIPDKGNVVVPQGKHFE